MRREGIQLGRKLRIIFYSVFGLLFVTGAVWWGIEMTGAPPDEFAVLQHWLLKGHGGAAMGSLFILGILYPLHIARGWRARRNRSTGGILVGVSILLIVTGYLLYYSGDDTTRTVASRLHTWIGLALPALVCGHILWGRRWRKAQKPSLATNRLE